MKLTADHPLVTQTNDEIDNTFALLKRGEREIELLDQHRSVTLVLGNAGSGKSTFVQWVTGTNRNSLTSKEVEIGEFIIEDGDLIRSTVVSKTLFPKLLIDSKNNASVYDCPGFSGTRSSSYDIAATYFVKKLTDHANFFKFVLTVNYPSVRRGLDQTDFPNLLKHTLNLIKSVDKFRDSIAIVVTKVDNTCLNDEDVIKSTASYLRTLLKTYEERSKLSEVFKEETIFCNKAITLLNILLTPKLGKTYPRIRIFRRPSEAGLLIKNIALLERGKKKAQDMMHKELKFTEKDFDDFGYFISDRSKIVINNFVAVIHDNVASAASAIASKVQNFYEKLIKEHVIALNSSENSKNIFAAFEIDSAFATDLEKNHRTIIEFYRESRCITNLKDLANKTKTYILIQLGIASCQQDVENIALQAKYLYFLEIVSSRTFTTRPNDWWNEFEKMGTYLATYFGGIAIFDRFLNELFKKLSEYNIQKDKKKYNVADLDDWGSENKNAGIQITQNNYKQFLEKLEEINLIGFDAQVKKVEVTDFQLWKLNHVLYPTLKTDLYYVYQTSEKLIIQGNFLKFSDFVDDNGKLINSDGFGQILSLNIYALHTLFIDRNLRAIGTELSIIAPKWQIIGSQLINVNGAVGHPVHLQQPETPGVDGLPGPPGSPGGNFLGIALTIIAGKDLTISANGGQGGQGQQGADGLPGEEGQDAAETWQNDKIGEYVICENLKENQKIRTKEQWHFSGGKGEKGGCGGNGGIGGFGGIGGKIKVLKLNGSSNLPLQTTEQGLTGHPGEGGNGGQGCSNGYKPLMQVYQLMNKLYHESQDVTFTFNLNDPDENATAEDGQPGSAGSSQFTFRENPIQGKPIQSISHTVRNYKSYLRENLPNYFNTPILLEFLHKIDNNVDIRESFDTLALVNELQDLEKQDQSQHPQYFLPFYESLLKRTSEYVSNPKTNEKSNSYKIILNRLYGATLGKIQILKTKVSESNLIIDLTQYLDSIQSYISDLKNFQEQGVKIKVEEKIKQLGETYKQNIDEKIKDADYLIETQVIPAISKISNQIQEKLSQLNDETIALKEITEKNKNNLQLRQEEIKLRMAKNWRLLYTVKMIGDIISCTGALGAIINTVISTACESFAADSIGSVQLPETCNEKLSTIQSLQKNLQAFIENPVNDFQNNLSTLLGDTAKYREGMNDITTCCEEAQITLYDKKVKKEFQTQLSNSETVNSSPIQKIISGAPEVLKKFKKIGPVVNFGLKLYKQIEDDKDQLKAVDEEIEKKEIEIQDVELYQTKIHEEMIPVCAKIVNILNTITDQIDNKSHVVLHVKQWQVQSILKDFKVLMKQFTKRFSVEHSLHRCIEKLDETTTTIINVYDCIQNYQDKQQLAAFIADVSCPSASDVEIANPALNTGMIELEKIILSNIILEQHRAAVNALKQHVFPFAYNYLHTFRMTNSNVPLEGSFQRMASDAVKEVKGLQLKVTEYKASIQHSDSLIRTSWFSSDYKTSQPFYVWQNYEYQEEICKLLSGEKVMFKANVLMSPPDKEAIKFNKISIKFNSENSALTEEISHQLKGFSVRVTHMGNSYYRFNDKVYIIVSAHQKILFSFEKDAHHKPVNRNSVYDKIESGDAILSPYAMWEIQLDIGSGMDFAVLEKYKTLVNLELEGYGCYVTKGAAVLNLDVENYYTVAETI